MFARAGLVAIVLASPAWADSDYPAGLFERSPLNDTPAAASRHGNDAPSQAKNPPRERASGGCHHLPRVALSVAATMLSRYPTQSCERKALVAAYVAPVSDTPAIINERISLFDGPDQREAQRLAEEALGEGETEI
jgi:hypothetical protein